MKRLPLNQDACGAIVLRVTNPRKDYSPQKLDSGAVSQPRPWFSLYRIVARRKELWHKSTSSLLRSWQKKPEAC